MDDAQLGTQAFQGCFIKAYTDTGNHRISGVADSDGVGFLPWRVCTSGHASDASVADLGLIGHLQYTIFRTPQLATTSNSFFDSFYFLTFGMNYCNSIGSQGCGPPFCLRTRQWALVVGNEAVEIHISVSPLVQRYVYRSKYSGKLDTPFNQNPGELCQLSVERDLRRKAR